MVKSTDELSPATDDHWLFALLSYSFNSLAADAGLDKGRGACILLKLLYWPSLVFFPPGSYKDFHIVHFR